MYISTYVFRLEKKKKKKKQDSNNTILQQFFLHLLECIFFNIGHKIVNYFLEILF